MTGDVIFGLIVLFLMYNLIGLVIVITIWNHAKYACAFDEMFDPKEIHDSVL